MGHAVGSKVEGSRERAAAIGERTDKAVDGGLVDTFWLFGTIVPIVPRLVVLNCPGFVRMVFGARLCERRGLLSREWDGR